MKTLVRNALAFLGALFLALPALAADKVNVKVKNFNDEDTRKIKEAVNIALDRWQSEKVANCIYDNVKRRWDSAEDEPTNLSRSDLKDGGLYLFVTGRLEPAGIRYKKSRFNLTIEGKDLGEANGQGQTPYKGIEKNPPQFLITLNTKNVKDRTADSVAGTIFHEMLHNTGETHGSNGTFEQNYNGYLIKEWGRCIAGNGELGFGLGEDRYDSWDE